MAMADAPTSRSAAGLKKAVSCPKCNKPFSQPKLLPCLHSVCANCLTRSMREGVRDRAGLGLRYIVACPVCAEETELPKSGVSSLSTAFFKENMVQVYRMLEVVEGKRTSGCMQCEGNESITAFCPKCKFVCSTCVRNHSSMKAFSDHRLIPLTETGRKSEQMLRDLSLDLASKEGGRWLCERHGDPLKVYCNTCKRLVCGDCTLDNHKKPQHKWEVLSSVISEQKSEIHHHIEGVRKIHTQARASSDDMIQMQGLLQQQKDKLADIVNTSFSELMVRLESLKKDILVTADEHVARKTAQITKRLECTDKIAAETECLVEIADECMQHCTDQEFMDLKRSLAIKLKEVGAKRYHTNHDVELPLLQLPLSCTEKIRSTCARHISQHHSLAADNTVITGEGILRAEVDKESRFIVQLKTKNKTACIEDLRIKVNVTVSRSNSVVPVIVVPDMEKGSYAISYTPTCKGECRVVIKVEGDEITGSPYCVPVKASKLDWTGGPKMVFDGPEFEYPWGVACGPNRQIYVTRYYQHNIAVLNMEGKVLKTLGIKGQKPGQLNSPTGIAVDKEGFVYVADGEDHGRVQKLDQNGQLVCSYGNLSYPHGLMLNREQNKLYVCDINHQCILVLDTDLNYIQTFGELKRATSTEGYEWVSGHLLAPHSVAEDTEGNIYVSDFQEDCGCVHVFDKYSVHLRTICHPSNEFFRPAGLCVEDNFLFVCDSGDENCVVVFRESGEMVTSCGSYGNLKGEFSGPLSIAVDLDGFLYICDHGNNRIQMF